MRSLDTLYNYYPLLKEINIKNNGIIEDNIIFKTYDFQTSIIEEENYCTGFMFVVKGKINIFKVNERGEETHLYDLSTGEVCHGALSCILFDAPMDLRGMALERTEVYFVHMDIVKNYLLTDDKFLKFIYMNLYNKYQCLIEAMENITHESIEERLSRAIRRKESNIIYITHEELAKEIGSSREVVSRKLKSFEKLGYVKLERGKIQILKELK